MSSGIHEIIRQARDGEDIFFVALIASGHVVLILGVLYCLSRIWLGWWWDDCCTKMIILFHLQPAESDDDVEIIFHSKNNTPSLSIATEEIASSPMGKHLSVPGSTYSGVWIEQWKNSTPSLLAPFPSSTPRYLQNGIKSTQLPSLEQNSQNGTRPPSSPLHSQQNGGPTQPNGGLTQQNGGLTQQNGGLTQQNGGPTQQNGGLTQQNGGPTQQNGGLTHNVSTICSPMKIRVEAASPQGVSIKKMDNKYLD